MLFRDVQIKVPFFHFPFVSYLHIGWRFIHVLGDALTKLLFQTLMDYNVNFIQLSQNTPSVLKYMTLQYFWRVKVF